MTSKLAMLRLASGETAKHSRLFYRNVLYKQKLSRKCVALFLHFATYIIPYNFVKAIFMFFLDNRAYKSYVQRIRFLGISLLPDGLLINYWADYDIIYDIYCFKTYEKFYEPKPGSIVFDVGSHVGVFCLRTSRKIGEKGLVVAIEPHPVNYRLLMLNLRLNSITNVIPLRVALSDKDGPGLLYVANDPSEHSLMFHKSDKAIPIHLMTLRSLVYELLSQRSKVSRVDLVKIDAEGSGLAILGDICDVKDVLERFVLAAYHTEDECIRLASHLISQGYKVIAYTDPDYNLFVYATRN